MSTFRFQLAVSLDGWVAAPLARLARGSDTTSDGPDSGRGGHARTTSLR
jgi:hypothetical protein